MAVLLARRPLGLSPKRTRLLDRGCRRRRVPGVAFALLAYAAYAAVTAALLVHLTTTGAAASHGPGSDLADAANRSTVAGEPTVLTITVDGPNASVDVSCGTTTDRAPFDHLHVRPDQVMDAFHGWCSPGPDYS